MARIRSTHPGQWTDEDFVACSFAARLLALGLRTEADDNGVFEWKPLVIKMRLFPADAVDVPALLAELSANRQVASFEHSGKQYGAIRNFRRWQRPEKPKSWHPLPDSLRSYVGLIVDQSPTDPPPVGEELSKVSADVGGRRKEVDEGGKIEQRAPERPPPDGDLLEIPEALEKRKPSRLPADWALPDEWRERATAARDRHGLPALNLDLEAEKFAAHWHGSPDSKAKKINWAATWQKWCLTAEPSRGNGNGQHRKPDQTVLRRAGLAAAFADVAGQSAADRSEGAGGEAGVDAGDLAPTGPLVAGCSVLPRGHG